MSRRPILGLLALCLTACPGDDGAADGGSPDTESGTTGTATASATQPIATMSGSGSSSSSTTDEMTGGLTTVADSSGSGDVVASTTDTGGSTTGTGGSTTGTGGEQTTYPACDVRMEPPCPRGYDSCFDIVPEFNICVAGCETVDECPPANGGEAEVMCVPFGGGTCVLDCPGGLACPAGMECVAFEGAGVERCLWPV